MIDSNETIMYENGRDAGYSKGYEDGLQNKIEIIKLHPTEAITLLYDIYSQKTRQKKCELTKVHTPNYTL